MAVTKGHGNPNWTREETALALELFFTFERKMPNSTDSKVIELSDYLRAMDIHKNAKKNSSFRNPDGIAFKVGNLRAVATGKGLQNTSKIDKAIWNEFGNNQSGLQDYCNLIRSGIKALEEVDEPEYANEDDFEFDEGKVLTKVHKYRERNGSLRKKLIAKLIKNNECYCEMCGVTPNKELGELSMRMFECHHIIPVSESLRAKTKLSELSLLCANCHRLMHAAISKEKKWLSINEAKKLLSIKTHAN